LPTGIIITIIITTIIATLTLIVPMITGTGMVSGGLTRSIEIPSARMDHIQSIRVGSAIIVTMINRWWYPSNAGWQVLFSNMLDTLGFYTIRFELSITWIALPGRW
jgi:hypothetical protein